MRQHLEHGAVKTLSVEGEQAQRHRDQLAWPAASHHLDRKPAALAKNFYPPAPNLISDPPDDPEWHIFFTIRTGSRLTAMPAWDGVLSEQDMWKLTSFLSHMDKLPPAVQDYWKNNVTAAPPVAEEKKDEEKKEGHKH